MSKPSLGVDADDVFWDLCGEYVRFHNQKHETNFRNEDVYTFDMVQMYNLPLETLLENMYQLLTTEHHRIVPFTEAVPVFKQLAAVYDLHIITSRDAVFSKITIEALEKHAPRLFTDFHFTSAFNRGSHTKLTKLAVCQRIGAVAHIEDAPGNIIDVANGGIPVYMHRRSWNTPAHHPELVKHKLVTPFTRHSELLDFL